MDRYVEGDRNARAIIGFWRCSPTKRFPHSMVKAPTPLRECASVAGAPEWQQAFTTQQIDKVVRMCSRKADNPFDADDLAQETLIELGTKATTAINDLMRYASGVIAHKHADALRGHYTSRKGGERNTEPLFEMVADCATDDYLLNREMVPSDPRIAQIAELLQDGLSMAQVGQQLGIKKESVRQRVMRYVNDSRSHLINRLEGSAACVIVHLTSQQKGLLAVA